MPIAPLDLQQLYMQQSHIGRMEHARMAAKTILTQSEDKDIHKDAYEKDSTVVKTEQVPNENQVQERKQPKRGKEDGYVYYRKKKRKSEVENDSLIESVDIENKQMSRGRRIDVLG